MAAAAVVEQGERGGRGKGKGGGGEGGGEILPQRSEEAQPDYVAPIDRHRNRRSSNPQPQAPLTHAQAEHEHKCAATAPRAGPFSLNTERFKGVI